MFKLAVSLAAAAAVAVGNICVRIETYEDAISCSGSPTLWVQYPMSLLASVQSFAEYTAYANGVCVAETGYYNQLSCNAAGQLQVDAYNSSTCVGAPVLTVPVTTMGNDYCLGGSKFFCTSGVCSFSTSDMTSEPDGTGNVATLALYGNDATCDGGTEIGFDFMTGCTSLLGSSFDISCTETTATVLTYEAAGCTGNVRESFTYTSGECTLDDDTYGIVTCTVAGAPVPVTASVSFTISISASVTDETLTALKDDLVAKTAAELGVEEGAVTVTITLMTAAPARRRRRRLQDATAAVSISVAADVDDVATAAVLQATVKSADFQAELEVVVGKDEYGAAIEGDVTVTAAQNARTPNSGAAEVSAVLAVGAVLAAMV